MKDKYLLSFLKGFYNNPRMDIIIDLFKVDFDYYLYAYGCQFYGRNNKEEENLYLYNNNKGNIKQRKKKTPFRLMDSIKKIALKLLNSKIVKQTNSSQIYYKKVLFVEPVSYKIKKLFLENNTQVVCLDDYNNDNYPVIFNLFKWYDSLNRLSFKERLQIERYDCLDGYISSIQTLFNDFDGLFVGNEEYFICKLFIDAFRGIGIPTYNWSHGIDCSYRVPMRVDYQLVWGEGEYFNLVNLGRKPDSIIVSGNINYFKIPQTIKFRNSIENILVLTSASVANIRHSWDYDTFEHWDRSLLITYIYSVEKVLKSCGVQHARLRPHPINNKKWIEQFIDTAFFEIDNLPLSQSLDKATLAIGPTSSTFVEALQKGVTYLIYEPGEVGRNIIGIPLFPPFDGSDKLIKVSFTEEQLKSMIETKYTYSQAVLDKYMCPFNINSFINTLGKREKK